MTRQDIENLDSRTDKNQQFQNPLRDITSGNQRKDMDANIERNGNVNGGRGGGHREDTFRHKTKSREKLNPELVRIEEHEQDPLVLSTSDETQHSVKACSSSLHYDDPTAVCNGNSEDGWTIETLAIPMWTTLYEDFDNNKRYTVFTVEVCMVDGTRWRVNRRYRDFRKLHKVLKSRYQTVKHLFFPPKRFFMSLAVKVIDNRKERFGEYLNALLAMNPRPVELETFLDVARFKTSTSTASSMFLNDHSKSVTHRSTTNSSPTSTLYGMQNYNVLKVIGKGSFGKVYLVRDKLDSKLYAMKVLTKNELRRRNQVEHTTTELRIMSSLRSPFIVHLQRAFQSKNHLYMVSEYVSGGELFFHLKKFRTFSESMVLFYAAELVLVVEYLHSKNIVYRDLKPENILIGLDGHLKITDFGLSRDNILTPSSANTFCGTPEYLAPEMLIHKKEKTGYGKPVDWWSLGTLMYEMLTGWPPFFDNNVHKMCDKILHKELKFPRNFGLSQHCMSLIGGLLLRDPSRRLGCRRGRGVQDIKDHAFFSTIDWNKLEQREMKPPFKPRVSGATDLRNFDKEFTKELPEHPHLNDAPAEDGNRDEFSEFNYDFTMLDSK